MKFSSANKAKQPGAKLQDIGANAPVTSLPTRMQEYRRMRRASEEVRYSRLSRDKDDFIDLQFKKPPPKIPYKAITLATVLFVIGSVLIIIGAMLLTGYIDAKYGDRTWPVLILGAVMFIPGAYHVRIAYYAYKGYEGYSFEDIPEFDE